MKNIDTTKILLVEDEWSHAKLVEVFLAGTTQIEVDISHVLSLKECLNTINKDNYDIVLLDLNLGDSNGIETLEKLFAVAPSASVVVLTGNDDEQVGINSIKKGAQDFLNKNQLDTATLTKTVIYASQRKKLQIDLAKSNQRLKEAQELAKLGNYEIDLGNKDMFWSDQLFKQLCVPLSSDVSYKDYHYKIVKSERAHVISQLKKAVKLLSDFNIEHRIKIKEKIYFVRNAGKAYFDEEANTTKVVGTIQDITEYKKTEKELEENRKRYEIIFNESQEAIYVSTFDGTLVERNQAFLNLVGLTDDQLKAAGNSVNQFYLNLEDRDKFKHEIQQKGAVKDYSIKLKKSNKINEEEIIDCMVSASLWKDFNGKTLGYQGFVRDITEQRKIEDLKRATVVAERAAKIKNQFLANMSHEIRTPMNVVIGMAELLESTNLSEQQKSYLSSMKISSENLMVIINAILDFSKIEEGKLFLEKSPFDLHKLIENLFQTFIYKAKQQSISLFKQLDANLPKIVIGDTLRLNQILLNLMSNAIKYTNEGEINLKAKVLEETDNTINIKFSVQDTGIGIPEEKLPYIFKSFTQASDDTSRIYGGTGLGLAIAKQLVELMQGKISVESEFGKGSTFTFNAIFEKQKAAPGEQAPTIKEKIETQVAPQYDEDIEISILLVEDQKMNQVVVTELLKREFDHIKIDIAENGRIGVDKIKENFYHLVLMDINMPVMGGLDATVEIRNNLPKPQSEIPIFALTAHAFSTEVENCKNAGMNEFVSKPINIKDLKSKIINTLNKVIPQQKKREKEILVGNHIELTHNRATHQNGHNKPHINGNVAVAIKKEKVVKTKNKHQKLINLNALKDLSGNNDDTLKNFVKMLLKNTPGELEKLQQDLNNEDWDNLTKSAHKLKSTVGYMGIEQIKNTIKTVENNSARKIDLDQMPQQVEEIIKICNIGLQELKEIEI